MSKWRIGFDVWRRRAELAEARIEAALEFADQWETLSEVSVGMIRILKGQPDGIRAKVAEAAQTERPD